MNASLPTSPSLASRIRARLAAPSRRGGSWRVAGAVAALIAAAAALTLAGAWWQQARAGREIARLERATAAARATLAARDAARAELAPLLARPGAAATIEALARTLPAEARLTRVARTADGRLSVEASAPDPDRLRTALRREPATRSLRDAGQRSGEGGMIVVLEGR